MDRDLYTLLDLSNDCTSDDIEVARSRAVKQILEKFKDDKDLAVDYINNIADLLANDEGRKCYDALVYSHLTGNDTHREMTLKRIELYNAQPGVVQIGPSMINTFGPRSSSRTKTTSMVTPCRFCEQPFDHRKESSILCKCSCRSGHTLCALLFKSEHVRCPVCRQPLLIRDGISKYMIYGTDKRYNPFT